VRNTAENTTYESNHRGHREHRGKGYCCKNLGAPCVLSGLKDKILLSIYLKIGTVAFVKPDRKTRLLDTAQRLVQTRGHNGFSFRDLSREVGIRTASIHYHFPSKTDLAVALVRRYRETIGEAMADIAVQKDSLAERLDATVRLYTNTLNNESRICVCAALAGEYLSLPRAVQIELGKLIADSERWIVRFLTEGRSRGEIRKESDPRPLARLWYAALQGALLVSRAGSPEILGDAAATLKKLTLTSA
jgi:TetR/AcrR family transcriptional repressor of nem operon